jgi:hypothetical protein
MNRSLPISYPYYLEQILNPRSFALTGLLDVMDHGDGQTVSAGECFTERRREAGTYLLIVPHHPSVPVPATPEFLYRPPLPRVQSISCNEGAQE